MGTDGKAYYESKFPQLDWHQLTPQEKSEVIDDLEDIDFEKVQ
jgi:hypothetical protein